METKTQRNLRLKNMRRKFYLGEFKHYKKSKSNKYKGVKMAKKYRKSSKKSGFSGGVWGSILGVGLFALVYEPFVSPMIPLSEPTKSIAELVVGVMFMNHSNNMVKNTARAAVVINAYQLMALYVKPMILGQQAAAF